MVATVPEVGDVILSVVHDLEPRIRVTKAILFGSYANGEPKKWSDIDLAIISPDFDAVPIWRRQEMMAELLDDADVRLSPIGYSPEDLANPTSFLREVLATGKVVYEAE